MVSKSAIIGIDLGTSDSYVAYVGKGVVDVVQNEVSKRATPTLVSFTERERLLGDSALAQIKSNAKNTCRNFKHLLGRRIEAPDLEKESFWSTSKLVTTPTGSAGYNVSYKGTLRDFSAVQITAMYLTSLRETTEKWCQAKLADVVMSVPSYFSDMQRQALLDAAAIAGMSVLSIMNEHTATALAYGIYRTSAFDERPITVAFCSMGHAIFSVAIVQFNRGKLTMLCEKSDLVGGRDMDECLMQEFAGQFQKKTGLDPLSNKKAAYKLEDAVEKTKKILSANSEANISVECLMEDQDFGSQITRDEFEAMCGPAIEKSKALLETVISQSPVPVQNIDSVEIVGGASRVPWVKRICSDAFGGRELSTTMNQEESVARGCALQAASLSPLFKVRDFKVEDSIPFPISLGWTGGPADGAEAEEGNAQLLPGGSYNTAIIFPVMYLNRLTIEQHDKPEFVSRSQTRSGPFVVKAEIADGKPLLPLTAKELGTFHIGLSPQQEPKKVKLRVRITPYGTFAIDGAQLLEEEECEAEATDAAKKTTRLRRTDLQITPTGRPGLKEDVLLAHQSEELGMQADMREIRETDERRNDMESYILTIRSKIMEGNEYGAYISAADRETFNQTLSAAEEWLYENPDSTKIQYIEKHDELRSIGDPVAWRCKEDQIRSDWITALSETLKNYRSAAESPGPKFGHIAREKLGKINAACDDVEKWLYEMKARQDTLQKHEKPVLLCAEMEKKNQELARLADEILKESKPIPPRADPDQAGTTDKQPEGSTAPPQPSQDEPANMEVDD